MMKMLDFTGKIVWVTGAGRGIGYEVATLFTQLGADVVGFDLAFAAETPPFECITLDVSSEDQVRHRVQRLLHRSPRLDVLVNAAGILRMGAFEETGWDDLMACISVNAGGAFLMLKHTIATFKQQRSGVIVTVSSNAAKVPRVNMAAYCASKAALSALNHTAALELAPFGVRCNIVCPGSTDTPMQRMLWSTDDAEQRTIQGFPELYKLGIPLGKIAQPYEIAQTIVFFASDMASHITLQDLVVDGGATFNV